jgi:hypothetical protein
MRRKRKERKRKEKKERKKMVIYPTSPFVLPTVCSISS